MVDVFYVLTSLLRNIHLEPPQLAAALTMSTLKTPIDLKQLTQGGVVFEILPSEVEPFDLEAPIFDQLSDDLLEYANLDCVDATGDSTPFDQLSQKMTNLTPDGKIKKRILLEGTGDTPQDFAVVKIHYNAYLEMKETPFDSTYKVNKPRKFTVNDHKVLAGLEFAVKSMKEKEKSQFLVHPDYAYGNCIGRIPSNSTVLFEVELVEITESGEGAVFEKLPEGEQQKFSNIYKFSQAMAENGRKRFKRGEVEYAVRDFNRGVVRLEKSRGESPTEMKMRQELLLKLYSNLIISYFREGKPRKGCESAEKIYQMTEEGELMKIPAKVYYNHGKCLRVLGELEEADKFLMKAHKMEPNNSDIANEILNLDRELIRKRENEKEWAKALVDRN